MYLRLKSLIHRQCAKKENGNQAPSDPNCSERRKRERRRLEDRRNSTILRGQARYNRRHHQRRDLLKFREPASDFPTESSDARLSAPRISTEPSDSLRLWIVSERENLISRLQGYSEKLSVISLRSHGLNRFKDRYEDLEDSSSNLILIDTGLLDAVVIEQLRSIRRNPSIVKIILLYDETLPDLVNAIVEYRVSGILPTGASQELFLKAVHAVHKGEYWFPRQLVNRILGLFGSQRHLFTSLQSGNIVFTECEQKATSLLVKRLSNK